MQVISIISSQSEINELIERSPSINNCCHLYKSLDDFLNKKGHSSANLVAIDIDKWSETERIEAINVLLELDQKVVVLSETKAFAYESIKLGVHDYVLLKNLENEIKILLEEVVSGEVESGLTNKVAIHCKNGTHYFGFEEIIRCEAQSNYTKIVGTESSIIIAKTLKKVESILPPELFYRTHKSHIVNVQHIKMIKHENGGVVVATDNQKIPISRKRKSLFLTRIKTLLL